MILDEKDNLLATIPVGGTYDFNKVFTQEGTYLCPIYAYADGFVPSEWGYVWVFIGETSGGGYGCATEHYAPTVSINGTVLTIVHNSMEYYDNNYIKATSEYYDIFVNGTRVGNVGIQLQGNTMTFDLAGKAVTGDVITVKTDCQFEADNESLAVVVKMN